MCQPEVEIVTAVTIETIAITLQQRRNSGRQSDSRVTDLRQFGYNCVTTYKIS
jgi:hypothetical protein